MASDANLIKGAATAYGAGTAAKQAGNQLGVMAQNLLGRVESRTADLKQRTAEAKERDRKIEAEIENNIEAGLALAGGLGQQEYNLTLKKVQDLRKEYDALPLGDTAGRRAIMNKMSMESQALQAEKDARKDNLELYDTLSQGVSRDDKFIMSAFSNPNSGSYTIEERVVGKDEKGNILPADQRTREKIYTFNVPQQDGSFKTVEMSNNEVQKLFDQQKDLTSTKMTKDMAVEQIKIGAEGGEFNETKIRGAYEDSLEGKNLLSALTDDWGVGSFRKNARDLVKAELEASPIDLDNDGADDDIDSVMSALTDPNDPNYDLMPEDVRKKYIVDYFVDAQRQQHEKGVQQAEKAAQSALQKEINKNAFENLKQAHRLQLQNAKSQDAIDKINAQAQADANKITIKKTDKIIEAPDKQDIPNPNWKEGDPEEQKFLTGVSKSQLQAIDKNLKDPNVRGVVGNFGYYYKDAKGNFRKFDNKQDFVKKQRIKIKSGETLDDAIERYKEEGKFRPEVQGLRGGKAIGLETIRSDEQLEAGKDQVVEVTSTSRTTNIPTTADDIN